MEKIKNYIKEHQWIDLAVILILLIICALLFSNHVFSIVSDRGRELYLPEQILNGAVPYKDITLIYFPLSYYINAIIYKILGVSVNSLMITQTFLCIFLIVIFHYIAKEFLSRRISFLLTIFILVTCIFAYIDIFNYIFPYAYAITYGIAGSWVCVFSIIKLFKTDKIKYAYIASLASGFAFACKLEFLMALIILIIGLSLYKKLKFEQYLKIFLVFLIIPLITLLTLFIQGVTIQNLYDAIIFAKKFATTGPMKDFLTYIGMYPHVCNVGELKWIITNIMNLFQIIFFCIIGLLLHKKYKNILILPIVIFLIYDYSFNSFNILFYWIPLSILMLIFVCYKFKTIKNFDKKLIFVIIAGFLLSQRTFFCMSLKMYAPYTFPFMALLLCIMIDRFAPKISFGLKTKNIVSYVLLMLIVLYTGGLFVRRDIASYPVSSSKGTLYTDYSTSMLLNTAVKYLEYTTDKNASVILLQEGLIINYITGQKLDLHCFMMDRLYYEAYGDKEAINLLKKANYDYLMIINVDISNFERWYLYAEKSNNLVNYIYDNYKITMTINGDSGSKIIIMKKRTPSEKKEYLQEQKVNSGKISKEIIYHDFN